MTGPSLQATPRPRESLRADRWRVAWVLLGLTLLALVVLGRVLGGRLAAAEVLDLPVPLALSMAAGGVYMAAAVRVPARLGRPWTHVAIYAWNPLLVVEAYSGGHVDLEVAAGVAAFVWALLANRSALPGGVLAGAVAVKLWPVLLVPFLVGWFRSQPRRLMAGLGVFALLALMTAALFAPALQAQATSGTALYARTWEANGWAYELFDLAAGRLQRLLALQTDRRVIGRAILMGGLAVAAVALAAGGGLRGHLPDRTGLLVMLMLLCSPVLWPWYYLPVVPLAAVTQRRVGLLLWTALLPLVYLPGESRAVAWAVRLPVWVVLAWEWGLRDRLGRRAAGHA